MSAATTDLLARLRQAGAARDANAAHAAATELMRLLPADEALALAHAEVERRLPAFEAHHPGADRPRRLLAQLAAGIVPEGDDADPELVEYAGPGGNNFSAALAALVRAVRAADARVRGCVDAIAQAIMAERTAHWGGRFPAEWRRWYESSVEGNDASDVLITMAGDPDCHALARAGWAHLADELERRLE